MKKKVLSMVMAFIMVMGIITISESGFVIEAEATTNGQRLADEALRRFNARDTGNCTDFIIKCANSTGLRSFFTSGTVRTMGEWFIEKNLYVPVSNSAFRPNPGDLVFFNRGTAGTWTHVGIVYSSTTDRVNVIHGGWGSSTNYTGTARTNFNRNGTTTSGITCGTRIIGFATPFGSGSGSGGGTPPSTHTVTYNVNGGTVSPTSRIINNGSAVGALPTPTRAGHTFNGWFTAATGGTQISASTTITSNVTFFARWTANIFTIVYNANGGIGNMPNTTVTYGVSANLRTNIYTREGHTFTVGWTVHRQSDNKWLYAWQNNGFPQYDWYVEGSQPAGWSKRLFVDGSSISGTITDVNNDVITLHAFWVANDIPICDICEKDPCECAIIILPACEDCKKESCECVIIPPTCEDCQKEPCDCEEIIDGQPNSNIITSISTFWTDKEWEILRLTNKERMKNGLHPFSTTEDLQKAASIRALERIESFSFTRPDGRPCPSVLQDLAIPYFNMAGGATRPMFSNCFTPLDFARVCLLHFEIEFTMEYTHMGVALEFFGGSSFQGASSVRTMIEGASMFNPTCVKTDIRIGSFSSTPTFTRGDSIDDLNLAVLFNCNHHGTSYMPLISEMCSGYNANSTSLQTITVNYKDLSTTFSLILNNPPSGGNNNPPSGGNSGSSGGGGGSSTPTTEIPTTTAVQQTIGITNIIVNMPVTIINTININIPVVQLVIPAGMTGNRTVSVGADFAGQNAILVKYNETTRQLEFVTASTVGANGNVNLNIAQTGDYLVKTFKTGDITGTGTVETSDALALLRHVAGISKLNPIQEFVANGKNSANSTADALNILRYVAGVIDEIN
ncbi:MAG: InlB B-repeat-containing protein [Oscillospiraceae bacterium]|jgi:uncharacterized repeat protein (TIGR02543 family)|nr:InlB B-repeat-containing protein [Oscillospiraceae bacterium]